MVIAANNTHVQPHQGFNVHKGINKYSEILREICYKYRKQRKESFIRDPNLCLVLLCFIIYCCKTDFNLFNRLGKAWTLSTRTQKINVIIEVFHELIRLIQQVIEEKNIGWSHKNELNVTQNEKVIYKLCRELCHESLQSISNFVMTKC